MTWTAQKNDLVGGWIVTTYPHPYSQHDTRKYGDLTKRGKVIAEFCTEEDAQLIAGLLNGRDKIITAALEVVKHFTNVEDDPELYLDALQDLEGVLRETQSFQ